MRDIGLDWRISETTDFEALVHAAIPESERLSLSNDFAGAPFLVDGGGVEQPPFISLSDEDGLRCIAWAMPSPESNLVGVGVDLAARGDFSHGGDWQRIYRRIFTEAELGAIGRVAPDDFDLGATMLFSAKEASFKACSQQIRRFFHAHDGEPEKLAGLYFETRDFEILPDAKDDPRIDGPWHAAGIAHLGDAARALVLLGIVRIELRFQLVGDKVLSLASAFTA